MSDPLPANLPDKKLLHLIEEYCNGTCSDDNFDQLEQQLRLDPSARAFYRRYVHLHAALADHGETVGHAWQAVSAEPFTSTHRPRWFAGLATLAVAAVLVLGAGLFLLLQNGTQPRVSLRVVAAFEEINGNVIITGTDAEARPAQTGMPIRSGDTIRTDSSASSALLLFPDGTRLSLVGNTSVTCSVDGYKSVVVHGGTLFASVAHQPAGKPMLVATPKHKVQVLGTKFSLTATAEETAVRVSKGRVRVIRLSDGKTVDVPAGRRIVSNEQADLTLHDIAAPPVDWSEDFEHGLPDGWLCGKFVFAGLPSGSKGGVQAVHRRDQQRAYYQICTKAKWADGLFTAHEDSHLHFTCMVRKLGAVNVFVLTRTKSESPAFSSNYLSDSSAEWHLRSGQWFTVTIPLAAFRRLSPGQAPIHRVIPFQVLFSSPVTDTGLVIDRMWVTRGGPGVVESKPVQ